MRLSRLKPIALAAALQLVAGALAAQNGVDQYVPAQPLGWVSDYAHLLDPATSDSVTALIERLKGATGAEVAVVTLPTIGDQAASDVALAIGRRWKVGARAAIGDSTRNAGLVLLLVPQQNHQAGTGYLRIEVGNGLEGIVTDAESGVIRRQVMGPLLAREAYAPAILAGVRALAGVIARGYGVSDSALTAARLPEAGGENGNSGLGGLLPVILIVVFILIMVSFRSRGGGGRGPGIYWGGGGFGGRWRVWRWRRLRRVWRRRRIQRRRLGGASDGGGPDDPDRRAVPRPGRSGAPAGLHGLALRLPRPG